VDIIKVQPTVVKLEERIGGIGIFVFDYIDRDRVWSIAKNKLAGFKTRMNKKRRFKSMYGMSNPWLFQGYNGYWGVREKS